MSIFNVATPMSRFGNLPRLQEMMSGQNVKWHLLLDIGATVGEVPDFIQVHNLRPPAPGFFPGHWFYNIFIDEGIEDDEYYNLMTDDDFFEPGMFDKIRPFDDPVIVTSMDRGKWGVLWATPEHMRTSLVGLEQIHVKGWLIKQWRLNGFYEADGFLIEGLWREHQDKFRFVPEAHCYFNYLPPGNAALW